MNPPAASEAKYDINGSFSTLYNLMPDVQISMEYVLKTLETRLPIINISLFGVVQNIAIVTLIYAIATHGLAMIASKNQDAINGFIVKLLTCVFLISGSSQIASGLRDAFYAVNGLGTQMSAGIVNNAISEATTLSMLATSALGAAGATKLGMSVAVRGLGVAAKTGVLATQTAAVGGAAAGTVKPLNAGSSSATASDPSQSADIERAKQKGLEIITSIEQWTSIVLVGLFPLMFAYYSVILSSGLLLIIVGLMLPIIAALSMFPSRIASISIGGSVSLLLGSYISTLFLPAFLGLCMAVSFVAPARHLNSELTKALNEMTTAAGVIAGTNGTPGSGTDVVAAFVGLAGRSSALNIGGIGEIVTSGGKTLDPAYKAKLDTAYARLTGSLVTAIVGVVVSLIMMVVGIMVMMPIMKHGPGMVGQIMGAMIHTGGVPNAPRIPTLPAQPKAALSGGSGGGDGGSRMSVKQIGNSRQALGAPKVSGDLAARGAGGGSGSGAGGGVTVVASASRHELLNRTVEARSGPRQALPPSGRG